MLRLDPYTVEPHRAEEVDDLSRVEPLDDVDDLSSFDLPLDPVFS